MVTEITIALIRQINVQTESYQLTSTMDLHGQVTEYLICELLKLERLGEWANDHRGGSGRGGKVVGWTLLVTCMS